MQLLLPMFPKEVLQQSVNMHLCETQTELGGYLFREIRRKLTHQIKKIRGKILRIQARFFPLIEQAIDETLDKLPSITVKQMEYKTTIDKLCENEDKLVEQRQRIKPRIKIGQMPDQLRYNKLKTESKLLMNVIKMICYRAESSVATCMAPFLAKSEDEKQNYTTLTVSSKI